ncbi:hypothetical protein ABID95_007942 [Streptomyces atratus]
MSGTAVAPWVATEDTGALLDFITVAFDGEEESATRSWAFDRWPDWPVMPSLLRVCPGRGRRHGCCCCAPGPKMPLVERAEPYVSAVKVHEDGPAIQQLWPRIA